MGKSALDLVEIYDNTGSMDLGKCQSIPLNNRYQVLETLQEDQVNTFGGGSNRDSPRQDGSWVTTDTSSLLPKLNSQISCSESKAVDEMLEQEVVHGPDLVSDSGDNSDTNFSLVPEFHKCKAQIGTKFGCVPLTPIYMYKGPPRIWNQIPYVLIAHKLIPNTGILNFLGFVYSSSN